MARFGKSSKMKLTTVHPKLKFLFEEVVKEYDCVIVCGHRNKENQDKVFREGKSKVQFPDSKHNSSPSMAVDVAPYIAYKGIPWNDHRQFYYFAGYVMAIAERMGTKIRWGGDWNMNNDVADQNFFDLPHFELL